jgi:hypothetical protein
MARHTWIAIVLAAGAGLFPRPAAAGEPTDVVRRHVERARAAERREYIDLFTTLLHRLRERVADAGAAVVPGR